MSPVALKYPSAPPYTPLGDFSSAAISCIARTFGAPVSVPAGNAARSRSKPSFPSSSRPLTSLTRCITCEYRSTRAKSSTFTVPGSHTFPKSLRPRSTSITCSARSFSSPSSSASFARSSAPVRPLGRVPAIGDVAARRPRRLTSSSGDDPTSSFPPSFR